MIESQHTQREYEQFLQFDDHGRTTLVTQNQITAGYSYRKVHFRYERKQILKANKQIFSDSSYQINPYELELLDPQKGKIILKRLYDLYRHFPVSQAPPFFPSKDLIALNNINMAEVPPFVGQIGLFPVTHYQSLFITQDFNENGYYEVIANIDGKFEADIVDDIIPVYEKTLQPVWGLNLENSWMVILLKFWAKINKSYIKLKDSQPFKFIQSFTNSNWKYFNLEKQGINFLDFYTPEKIQFGKFILKTKDNGLVYEAGLIPNCAGYELISIKLTRRSSNPKERAWVLTIRSTLKNKWAGKMSVLDQQMNSSYRPSNYTIRLERDFMMNHLDFLNLFSASFISSKREKHNYFSNFYLLNVPANTNSAKYIKFDIGQQGFFDFAIKQYESNKKQGDSKKSRIMIKQENAFNDSRRYLRCHFILVKLKNKDEQKYEEYHPLKYYTYEIEYFKGYNKGDARFQQIQKGTYILRMRTQTVDRPSTFVINYTSNSRFKMKQVQLTKQQSSQLLRQAMGTFIDSVPSFSLNKKNDNTIAYGELFQQTGYGFIGGRSKVSCEYSILIELDPIKIRESGYRLKSQFKSLQEPFSILIKPGETNIVVLKKVEEKSKWPPEGIQIFKQG